jgi:hypothetical protein
VTESNCALACNKVSVMTSFQYMSQPEGTPARTVAVRSDTDVGDLEWPVSLETIAELADPMQSEIVKGWLLSNLCAPK